MTSSLGKALVGAAIVLSLGSAQAALRIYADFNGDTLHDAAVSVAPGASFTMGVYAAEDGAHGGLSSYGLEVLLQPTLAVAGANAATQLANIVSNAQWDLPETKTVSPRLDVIDGSFFDTFSGNVHLFDVTLQAPAGLGAYTVAFKNVEPDATFDGFVGFDGFVYDPSNGFEMSTVNVVPEPAAAVLMALGVGVLVWGARRRQVRWHG